MASSWSSPRRWPRDRRVPLADDLDAVTRSGNSVVIAAESDGELAGYVELTGGSFRRNKTTAYLVIGVLAEAGGQFVDEFYMAAILDGRDPE